MAQSAAITLRRRILGLRQESSNDTSSSAIQSTSNYHQNRSSLRLDRGTMEKIWKRMDRIVKYCQLPKMNLKNSPPYMLDILPDFYQTLREIMTNYEDRLHILNDIDYFRIFISNLRDLCTKTIDCFKRAGHHMFDEQSTYRKQFIKFSLYFSHNLAELKSLFNKGVYEGERFRITKQDAAEFWKDNFSERTIIPWEEFREKLIQVHPIQSISDSIALQSTIDLTNNNHVSIFEFDVFTRLFHPWSSILTNWKLLTVTHPGFMAFMTYDEVKEILTNYIDKPGSYVFRLSCTRLGQWAIGYVTTQNTILQTIPQTKPLVQSLIDGEREGYYRYPNGKNIHVDLFSALRPTESVHIDVTEEQYELYSDMGTSFELCKICSTNNKDTKIQPCGHLICQVCLVAWQNQTGSKPTPLCPFCRSEIKGVEPVIINPFDSSTKQNQIEFDNLCSVPPPIPPRPGYMKLNKNKISSETKTNDTLSLPQQMSGVDSRPLSSISSNDSYSDPFSSPLITSQSGANNYLISDSEATNPSADLSINTIDQLRNRLVAEDNFDLKRVEAALILTEGLPLSKQYILAKSFFNQIKYEQNFNGSLVNEID